MSSLESQLGGKAVAKDVVLAANVATVVIGPLDVQRFDRYTVYVHNVGANPIETVVFETSAKIDGPWSSVDATVTGGAIAAATLEHERYYDRSYKYIKLTATSAAGSTVSMYMSMGGLE